SETACGDGTYSKEGSDTCTECPAGHSCASKSADPVKCPAKQYAPSGSLACIDCPVGSYCPTDGLSYHITCANGTYTTAVNQTECATCPAGSKCPDVTQAPVACTNGYYKGTHTACLACPAGSYCPSDKLSTHLPCPNGTYTTTPSQTGCSDCPPGHRCPHAASAPVVCDNGTFSLGKTTECTICPAGYRYC
ncbi:predicted protein, partial [Nematostella vectensis]